VQRSYQSGLEIVKVVFGEDAAIGLYLAGNRGGDFAFVKGGGPIVAESADEPCQIGLHPRGAFGGHAVGEVRAMRDWIKSLQ
jgi:hypothetical protein